jgi:PhnB protein
VKIGDSMVMLADAMNEGGVGSPQRLGGSSVLMHVYVPNVDAFVAKALAEGAKLVRPIADQFYGDRTAGLEDPFGHQWYVATHIEDLTPAELKRRGNEAMKKKPG